MAFGDLHFPTKLWYNYAAKKLAFHNTFSLAFRKDDKLPMAMADKYREASVIMNSVRRLFGDSPQYSAMQKAVTRMCDKLNEVCTPDEFGVRPVFTPADNDELRCLQDKVVQTCLDYIDGRNPEDVKNRADATRLAAALQVVQRISMDKERIADIDFSKNMTLREVISRARGQVETVDLEKAETTSGSMSTRIYLPATESRPEGYFTPSRYAESLEIMLARMVDEMKRTYPKYMPYIRFLSQSERGAQYGVVQRSADTTHTHCADRVEISLACSGNEPAFHDYIRDYLDALRRPMQTPDSRQQAGLPAEWSLEEMMERYDFREMLFKLHDQADYAANQYHVLQDTGILVGRDVSQRNVAMSVLAERLGHSDLLARASNMTLVDQATGKEVVGVFMEKAKGLDLNRQHTEPLFFAAEMEWDTPQAKLQLTSMQVIDWICGNTDRHTGNMFYDLRRCPDGVVRLMGVQGIDNDNSFGTKSVKELINSYGTESAGHILPTPETMGIIRRDDALKVLHLEKKDLSLLFFNLLWPDEIEAAWDRVEALQRAILKGERVHWKDQWETRRNIVRTLEDEEIAQMPRSVYAYLPSLKRLVKIPKDLESHRTRRLAG